MGKVFPEVGGHDENEGNGSKANGGRKEVAEDFFQNLLVL
jgi:hypothetical protein